MDQLYRLTIEQVLSLALNNQGENTARMYACALSKSRQEEVTDNGVQLVGELVKREGSKWLEVVNRMAVNDYNFVFRNRHNNLAFMPVLISNANYSKQQEQLRDLTVTLFNQIAHGNQTLWYSYNSLIRNHLALLRRPPCDDHDSRMHSQNHLFAILAYTSGIMQKINQMLLEFYLYQKQHENEQESQEWSTNVMEVYGYIGDLYHECNNIRIKELQGVRFQLEFREVRVFLVKAYEQVVEYIGHYERNRQQGRDQNKQNNFSKITKLRQYLVTKALEFIQILSSFPQFQLTFVQHSQPLSLLLLSHPLLLGSPQPTDILNFEYGLITSQYGDDVPSRFAQTIVVLSKNIPYFMRKCLSQLSEELSKVKSEDEYAQLLIKVMLLHKKVNTRDDLIQQYVKPMIDGIFKESEVRNYTILIQCRQLRLLFFYAPTLTQAHFSEFLSSIVRLLISYSPSSYAYSQADNLLTLLLSPDHLSSSDDNSRSRLSSLLQNKIPYLVDMLLNIITQLNSGYSEQREEKMYRLVKLMRSAVNDNQKQVKDKAMDVVRQTCSWLLTSLQILHQNRKKHSPLIYELAHLAIDSIELVDDEHYIVINENIYALLHLLREPQNIDIVEELLELLRKVIRIQEQITPQLCQVLVLMERVAGHFKNNLIELNDVLTSLNQSKIADYIMGEYPELASFLARLYLNYFEQLTPDNWHYYQKEIQEVCNTFQLYLQRYAQTIEDQEQLAHALFMGIRAMCDNAWRIRFFLILHHIRPMIAISYDFFNLSLATQLQTRGTLKLTFMYYTDKLIHSYQPYLLEELITFSNYFRHLRQSKQLIPDSGTGQLFSELDARTYLQEGVKMLKQRRQIQLDEYFHICQTLKLTYKDESKP